jgi:hypothetical protein
MLFKHTDDDGELSVFTSGDQVLVACNQGHYWTFSAAFHEPEADQDVALDPDMHAAMGRFGNDIAVAMGMRRLQQ